MDCPTEVAQPKASERCASFWTTPDVKAAGVTLLVKRHRNEMNDNIYICRVGIKKIMSFKFPYVLCPALIDWIEMTLNKIDILNDRVVLCGLEKVTKYEYFYSDKFWSDTSGIKLLNFHIRPYESQFGRPVFRLWQEIDPAYTQVFQQEDNVTVWRGPNTWISFDALVKLLPILKEIVAENTLNNVNVHNNSSIK